MDLKGFNNPTKHTNLISKRIFCGITGGTASGKTTLCKNLQSKLSGKKCVIISQDSYYKSIGLDEEKTLRNWDIPDALELSLLGSNLNSLKHDSEPVWGPDWDFVEHTRKPNLFEIPDADVYLVEGIFVLTDPYIRNLLDMKIFVEVDSDTRLSRRIVRDITERGRTLKSVLFQYETYVKPGYDTFTHPSRQYANVIVPYQRPNELVENMIVSGIKDLF